MNLYFAFICKFNRPALKQTSLDAFYYLYYPKKTLLYPSLISFVGRACFLNFMTKFHKLPLQNWNAGIRISLQSKEAVPLDNGKEIGGN